MSPSRVPPGAAKALPRSHALDPVIAILDHKRPRHVHIISLVKDPAFVSLIGRCPRVRLAFSPYVSALIPE